MSRFRRRWAPRLTAVGHCLGRRAAGLSAALSLLAVGPLLLGMAPSGGMRPRMPVPPPGRPAPHHTKPRPRTAAHGAFSQIVLPDLVVIEPHGLSAARVAALGRLPQVRSALGVDGASVTVNGRRVNLIGVNAAAFRPWTPLRTASDQRLWTALASGGFIASPAARRQLGLRRGERYQLGGGQSGGIVFGGAGALGMAGVDLVVGNAASARLGLIPNVATLISAPGAGMGKLRREVRRALGPGATLIGMRRQQLPVDSGGGSGRPTTYLELFKRSAALYCPGMSWTVLAAIGQIESGDGANNGPSSAGALGPMQFMPSTWARWGIAAFGEPGQPNIMDPYDAVPSAARYLCAAGAGAPSGLQRAIYAYNHAGWYVREVLALAQQYARAYG